MSCGSCTIRREGLKLNETDVCQIMELMRLRNKKIYANKRSTGVAFGLYYQMCVNVLSRCVRKDVREITE